MRKYFCALFVIFCFSLFAQESEQSDETVSAEAVEDKSNLVAPEKSEVDLSQDYLAQSSSAVNAVAWTRDGKNFATSWNNSIILWNAANNNIGAIYSNSVAESVNPLVNATSLQFTSDGRYMLSVRNNNTVLIHGVDSQTDATLITGTGNFISDAVYAGDYKIVLPLDGQNLYESYKSGDQYIVEEVLDFSDGVWGLSANASGKRILVTSESGAVRLVDSDTWDVLSETSCYTLSRIKPKFAPDGIHFVVAESQNKLVVASTANDSDSRYIVDPSGFSHAVDFSSDSSLIVVGISSGCVKIFDIETGFELQSFKLMSGDIAKSLALSPDDEYVVIGTEQGYIYRWVLSGEEFVPDYSYYQEMEYETGVTGANRFGNVLLLNLGFSGLNSDYYIGRFFVEGGYRHFLNKIFYLGGDISLGMGFPSIDYPYKYSTSGGMLNSPYLYNLGAGAVGGVSYFYKPRDLRLFVEAGVGLSVSTLFDNSFSYAHSSGPYLSFVAQGLAGLQWHWVRLAGGVQYDSTLKLLPVGKFGIAIPTRFFRK